MVMNIIKPCFIMLFLISGVFACIGNPNGVSLSFLTGTINTEKIHEFCESATCLEREDSTLYVTEEGLAVSIYKNKVNIEIPITEEGQPVLNFTDWENVIERELTTLAKYGVLNLTKGDIEKIVSSGYVGPGAILLYEKKLGTTNEENASVATADVQIARSLGESTYCSGPPILVSELPKQETEGGSDIQSPFWGYQMTTSMGAPGSTDKGSSSISGPSIKDHLINYWWIPLLVFAVVFLVLKLQFGDKEEKMSSEDLMVLSAPRRIGIMKSLTERRKTLTELSKEANIALPTAKEHLQKLEKSGLVKKVDTGHKWKYYELTKKGRRIVESTDFKDN